MENTKSLWGIVLCLYAVCSTTGCSNPTDSTNVPTSVAETEPTEPLSPTTSVLWRVPEAQPRLTMAALPEPETPMVAVPISQEPYHCNPKDPLPTVPLDKDQATAFLDLRGVGDTAMAMTHEPPYSLTQSLPSGVPANFGHRLDAFDLYQAISQSGLKNSILVAENVDI